MRMECLEQFSLAIKCMKAKLNDFRNYFSNFIRHCSIYTHHIKWILFKMLFQCCFSQQLARPDETWKYKNKTIMNQMGTGPIPLCHGIVGASQNKLKRRRKPIGRIILSKSTSVHQQSSCHRALL